ncbi:4590_t:CDS:2 [Diversispora eburnea]|uniref:4590_t:CDS:1 n=1 Tax=Diversispora eburnea TaxID=1213867 RepID=A0A9N9AYI7_9GLOM|nr:4590_t:CDS:2 [Diversispora eburnea]
MPNHTTRDKILTSVAVGFTSVRVVIAVGLGRVNFDIQSKDLISNVDKHYIPIDEIIYCILIYIIHIDASTDRCPHGYIRQKKTCTGVA